VKYCSYAPVHKADGWTAKSCWWLVCTSDKLLEYRMSIDYSMDNRCKAPIICLHKAGGWSAGGWACTSDTSLFQETGLSSSGHQLVLNNFVELGTCSGSRDFLVKLL
jgi:hypothetical protein